MHVTKMTDEEILAWHKYQCKDCIYMTALSTGKDMIGCYYIASREEPRGCGIDNCKRFTPKSGKKREQEKRAERVAKFVGGRTDKRSSVKAFKNDRYNKEIVKLIKSTNVYRKDIGDRAGIDIKTLEQMLDGVISASRSDYDSMRHALDELLSVRDEIRGFLKKCPYSYRQISFYMSMNMNYVSARTTTQPSEEWFAEVKKTVQDMESEGIEGVKRLCRRRRRKKEASKKKAKITAKSASGGIDAWSEAE